MPCCMLRCVTCDFRVAAVAVWDTVPRTSDACRVLTRRCSSLGSRAVRSIGMCSKLLALYDCLFLRYPATVGNMVSLQFFIVSLEDIELARQVVPGVPHLGRMHEQFDPDE
eukprot:732534-Pyramimonas_sp.AAC.1